MKNIIASLLVLLIVSGCTSFDDGKFLERQFIYLGFDHTFDVSQQCIESKSHGGGVGKIKDKHLNSNFRLGTDIWESKDKGTSFSCEFIHHSCVSGIDYNAYDAFSCGMHKNF